MLSACSVVFILFICLHTQVGMFSRMVVKMSSITSKTSTEHPHQYAGLVKVNSDGNFVDRVAAFNTFLSSLRLKELKRQGMDAFGYSFVCSILKEKNRKFLQ